jgi:uncharacterized protein YacL
MSTANHTFGNFILILVLSIISSAGKYGLLSFSFAVCTVPVFITIVLKTALLEISSRNPTITSSLLQKKIKHQEMHSLYFEQQLTDPQVRLVFILFVYCLIKDAVYLCS